MGVKFVAETPIKEAIITVQVGDDSGLDWTEAVEIELEILTIFQRCLWGINQGTCW